jgi:hypothetical protein
MNIVRKINKKILNYDILLKEMPREKKSSQQDNQFSMSSKKQWTVIQKMNQSLPALQYSK